MIPKYVTVVGSSNTDLSLTCEQLPQPGQTVLGGALGHFAGGKGANQAVAAARALRDNDVKVAFVGKRGKDDFGRQANAALHREGINIRHFSCHPTASSGVALILIGGRKRENMIAVAQSANDTLSPQDITAAKVLFRRSAVILCQLEVPLEAVVAASQLAAEYGCQFILNPAPVRRLPHNLLAQTHILTPNKEEALQLSGETTVRRAAKKLLAHGRKVAITLGADGVLLCDENGFRHIHAPKVTPRDTVGAGDCFNGWLAAALAEGKSFDEAAALAVHAAAIAVTRPGAQAGMPLRKDVKVLL